MLDSGTLRKILVTLPTTPFRGTLWRAVHDSALHDPSYAPAPLYCKGATAKGTRYTPVGGPPSLYLAEKKTTADAEANQSFRAIHSSFPTINLEPPTTTFHVSVELDRVLDVTDPAIQASLKTNLPELVTQWRFFLLRGLLAPTQELGLAVFETRHAQAIKYPSAAASPSASGLDDINYVVFCDLLPPGFVEVFDPSGKLSQRLPQYHGPTINSMEILNGLPIVLFESAAEWERWLEAHFAEPDGLWLKIAKKGTGRQSVSYAEALDVALCFGWIDGQKNSLDADYFLQKFTPRRPKSLWSKVNIEKVAALTASARMRAPGHAAVEAAKGDGRWDQAYDSHRTMEMPADFQAALEQNPEALAFFTTLNKTNIYALLWRIQTAKTAKTRQARIEKCVAMLAEQKTFH